MIIIDSNEGFNPDNKSNKYWLCIEEYIDASLYEDKYVAEFLSISYEKYIDILYENGGYKPNGGQKYDSDSEVYFRSRKCAEKALSALEPYIVMAELRD